ncbi:MAG: phosphatidate cytidylyltransferase [Planctomycetota bacterium]
MLRDRLRTSAVLIAISVTLVLLDWGARIPGFDGVWLYPLLIFFSLGTAWEIASILLAAGHVIRRSVAVVGAGLVSFSGTIPLLWEFGSGYPADCPVGRLGWMPLVAVLTIFGILVSEMRYFDRTMLTMDRDDRDEGKSLAGETIQRTCAAVFVSLYVGLPMSMLVATRMLHADETAGRFGLAAIITLLAVTKITDAGAFFAGRAFGRRKLIPSLSPAKTVEGAAGGVIAATIVAYLCLEFLFGWFVGDATADKTAISESAVKSGLSGALASPVWGACVLGPAVAISAMLGDLAESLFKRDAGVKDSGTLLPGLGGVWDVTDSLLAAIVPAFFCFAAGVGGQ